MTSEVHPGLSRTQSLIKRAFDLIVALPLLVATAPIVAVAWLLASIDTRQNGLFRQVRVGRDGEQFEVLKIRTMRSSGGTTVTTARDARITRIGGWFRKLKIDELPQLVNVVRGEMSMVGPRPDVPGFADALSGADRLVLSVRPGITGPAAIAFRHEQDLLAGVEDPETYNREVIWPAKVALNREYVEDWTLRDDVHWVFETVASILSSDSSGDERARSDSGRP